MLVRANITPEVGLKVVKQAKIYTIRVVVVVVVVSSCVCVAVRISIPLFLVEIHRDCSCLN
jgi:hypothetical protein